jgi:hypothetical protein
MDFHTFTTLREACKRAGGLDVPTDDRDQFYRVAFTPTGTSAAKRV